MSGIGRQSTPLTQLPKSCSSSIQFFESVSKLIELFSRDFYSCVQLLQSVWGARTPFFHRLIGLKSEVYWLSSEIAVLTLRVWLTMAIFFPLDSYNSLPKTQILGQFRSRRFVGASWKFGDYARDSKIDHSWSKRKVFYLFFSPQHNTTNSTPH